MTDKENQPAPSGASSLFGCGTEGADSDCDRERSADALCWLLIEVEERLQRCKAIRYDNVDETRTEKVCIQRVNDWKAMRELVSLAIAKAIKDRKHSIAEGR